MRSDFSIRAEQRQRLLEGDYRPFVFRAAEFPDDERERLPVGCKRGARYVMVWQRPEVRVYHPPDQAAPNVVRTLEAPLFYITVTHVTGGPLNRRERADGSWLVRYTVTDNRDRDTFLRRGGGYQSGFDELAAGRCPDPDWLDSEAEAISEFWERERLDRVRVEVARQSRSRARRNAA